MDVKRRYLLGMVLSYVIITGPGLGAESLVLILPILSRWAIVRAVRRGLMGCVIINVQKERGTFTMLLGGV